MKILIAEDELIIAMEIKGILEKRGFEIVYISSSVENTIRGVKEYKPAIVLMDLTLPGEIDSVSAAAEITSRYGIPLIFLMAHSDEETLKREKKTEPYSCILKPICEYELCAAIVTCLHRRDHRHLHSIAEASSSMMILVNREGKIIFANNQAERLIGISRGKASEQYQNSPEQHVRDSDGNPFPEFDMPFKTVMETGKPVYHIQHAMEADERMIQLSIDGFPLFNGLGEIDNVIITIDDITERENMQPSGVDQKAKLQSAPDEPAGIERELLVSEKKFKSLFNLAPDAIYLETLDGSIIDCNEAACKMTGYSRKELMHMNARDLVPAEVAETFPDIINEGLTTGKYFTEAVNIRKSGEHFPIEVNINIIEIDQEQFVLVVAHDITNRKKAEQALRESEEKYRNVVERANDVIGIIQDGKIKYINSRVMEIFGYSSDEVIGTDITRYVHPDALPEILDRYEKRFAGEELPSIYETTLIHKNGNPAEVELSGGLISYQGKPADLVVIRDITERKRGEEMLRESERAFRELADLLPQTVFECDLAGKFTYANRYGFESFGYTLEDFERGVNILDMLIPEDREKAVKNVQNLYQDAGHIGNEYTAMRKDGSTFPVKIYSSSIIRNDKPVGLRGIVLDMTEIKIGELALSESEERYRVIAENAFDAIWTMDMDLHFTYISPSVHRLFGYNAEEMMHRSLDELFTPESYEHVMKIYAEEITREATDRHVDQNRSLLLELEHFCKDGSTIPVEIKVSAIRDENKKLIGIIGVTRDISDRKKAEEKYQTLIENINIAIFVIQDMKIKYINPKGIDISGYSSIEELESRDFIEFVHPDDREVILQRHMQRLGGEKITEGFHFRIFNKSGDTRWMEYGAMAIDWEGKPAILSFMTDITERKLAEEQIKISLKEKDMLLKEIHHRVKNNMQVISSLLNIQSRHVSDERDKELFRESQNRVRSMALIHEKLYQSEDLSRINFAKYLTSITKELFQSYKISPELIELTADVTETHLGIDIAIPCALIINELVSNSLKYAFPDGRRGHIQIYFNHDKKGTYTLIVSDDGIGFPKDLNFQNTESLGLQLVNTLTRQLNGKIELVRKKGTRFTIRF
jgi:PAS domain S-box-containing protein